MNTALKIETWSPLSSVEIEEDEETREALRYCLALGLSAQIKMREQQLISYRAFNPAQERVWRAFLPRTYQQDEWWSYHFDLIPLPVLRKIQEVKAARIFSRLEIWTPEEMKQDPLCVGRDVSGAVYPIARWGESLLSYPNIRKQIRKRVVIEYLPFLLIPPFSGLVFLPFFIMRGLHRWLTQT